MIEGIKEDISEIKDSLKCMTDKFDSITEKVAKHEIWIKVLWAIVFSLVGGLVSLSLRLFL